MTAPNGIGNELGTGLGAFATQFVGTQNTIRQQQDALAQQQRDNQYRDQQAAAQLTQNNFANDYNNRQLAQQTSYQNGTLASTAATNGADARLRDFAVVGKQYTDEGTRLQAQLQAATSAGDTYLIKHAVDRIKRLNSLMGAVNLSTQDDGYWGKKKDLVNFMQGTAAPESAAPPAGAAPAQAPAPTPATPAPMDYSFAAPMRGDALANGDTTPRPPAAAPTPAQAAPAPSAAGTSGLDKYANLSQIPISELVKMDPSAVAAHFGGTDPDVQDGVRTYYNTHKQAYDAAVVEEKKNTHEAQVKFVTGLSSKLLDDPLHPGTPEQGQAAYVATTLISKYELTPDEGTRLFDALKTMMPSQLNAGTWNDLLKTGNATTIMAAYPLYQAMAPSVVSGFDTEPYTTQIAAELDAKSAATANLNASATSTLAKLPGDLVAQGDTHLSSVATTANIIATAASTTQATDLKAALGGATSLAEVASKGVAGLPTLAGIMADPAKQKLLGLDSPGGMSGLQRLITSGVTSDVNGAEKTAAELEKLRADTRASVTTTAVNARDGAMKNITGVFATLDPKMSYDQIGKQMPGLIAATKSALGLNDTGMRNLIREAQYNYGLGLRDKEL